MIFILHNFYPLTPKHYPLNRGLPSEGFVEESSSDIELSIEAT